MRCESAGARWVCAPRPFPLHRYRECRGSAGLRNANQPIGAYMILCIQVTRPHRGNPGLNWPVSVDQASAYMVKLYPVSVHKQTKQRGIR